MLFDTTLTFVLASDNPKVHISALKKQQVEDKNFVQNPQSGAKHPPHKGPYHQILGNTGSQSPDANQMCDTLTVLEAPDC